MQQWVEPPALALETKTICHRTTVYTQAYHPALG